MIFIILSYTFDFRKIPTEATAFIPEGVKEARLNFAHPNDSRPLVVDINNEDSKNVEYQYIYPSQIIYASSEDIKLLFRDSIFVVTNHFKLKRLKENLQSSHGAAFLYTQNFVINRAAIIGLKRVGLQEYNYKYKVKLINDEELPISKDIYKKIKQWEI